MTFLVQEYWGNAKQGSDIDLAVFGQSLTPQVLTAFQAYLEEETKIPYFLDIIHFEKIENLALREHIKKMESLCIPGKHVSYQEDNSVIPTISLKKKNATYPLRQTSNYRARY